MRHRVGVGVALIALGVLVTGSAIVGPLVLGVVRFHVSASAEAQLVGGEVVSLFVVAPLAIVAGLLWMRGSALAPALALGPALYSLYMYVQYIVGPQYERYPGNNEYMFPVYLALIILGWSIAHNAWRALATMPVPRLAPQTRRLLAILLFALNLTFAAAWISSGLAPI